MRIGPAHDGGYLLPDDFAGLVACFSPGVGNRKGFEDHLAKTYGVATHLCDFSSSVERLGTPLIPGLQTFKKLWLDVTDGADSIRLDTWVDEMAEGSQPDLILQMDIEGAEYRNLLACHDRTLGRFRTLVFELHGLNGLLDADIRSQVLLPFLRKIDAQFFCVHVHPNNCCGQFNLPGIGANIPNVLELTFLRRERRDVFAAEKYFAPMSPHPEDIGHCVPDAAPIYLNDCWLAGPRPTESRVRRLEDDVEALTKSQKDLLLRMNSALEAALGLALRASRPLSLDHPNAKAEAGEELAVGRPFRASSTHGHFPIAGVVPLDGGDFFFHTRVGVGESITIDLGAMHRIGEVRVWNRRDACFERAKMLFAVFHTEPDHEAAESIFAFNPPSEFWKTGSRESRLVIPPERYRFVTILSPAATALHLSKINIFAAPIRPTQPL